MGQRIISKNCVVVVTQDQVSCELGGETAILNSNSGIYYGLSGVGVRIWSLIQQPRRVNEVLQALVEEYEVEPSRCETDLLNVLEELVAKGLIEIKNEPTR